MSDKSSPRVRHFNWDNIPKERVTDAISPSPAMG